MSHLLVIRRSRIGFFKLWPRLPDRHCRCKSKTPSNCWRLTHENPRSAEVAAGARRVFRTQPDVQAPDVPHIRSNRDMVCVSAMALTLLIPTQMNSHLNG